LPITSATRFSANAGELKSQNEHTAKTVAPTARISKSQIGDTQKLTSEPVTSLL
jgi:hypothetical protein